MSGTSAGSRARASKSTARPPGRWARRESSSNGAAAIPAEISADGRRFHVAPSRWRIEKSGFYRFDLTDRDGIPGGRDDRWPIDALPDAPPEVSIEQPAADLYVAPRAVVAVRISASDDLAVREIDLVIEPELRGAAVPAAKAGETPAPQAIAGKGTAPRGRNTREDRQIAEWLHNDAKNRSENVMIVDLLRNDLGRVARFGTVHAENLFSVERFPTLWQMTSTVTAELRPDVSFHDIFRALFPCGSVTGTPKVRAMQLLAQLEGAPRGVYTGAIGFFSPQQTVFNVAIRTLELSEGPRPTSALAAVLLRL